VGRSEIPLGAEAWLLGIQRIHLLRDVVILAGAGGSGGSLVYANTLYEPKGAFYHDRQWARITDWRAELAPYYGQAKRMLGVVPNPTITPSDEVLKQVAEEITAQAERAMARWPHKGDSDPR
jgi:cholesterol oxidase